MFTGEYYCKIDTKGRLILPVKFREKLLGNKVVITKGLDQNLDLYDLNEWNKVLEKINKLDEYNDSHRRYRSIVIGLSHELEIDSQGRINIPQSLILRGKLEKEIAVVGNFSNIQLWNKDNWINYIDETIDKMPDIMKMLGE